MECQIVLYVCRRVVFATGGLGHVYATTPNPAGLRGEGQALTLLAGATPTALNIGQGGVLASEPD